MEGFRSVGAFEPNMDGYFGWVEQKGFPLPPNREDIWLPEGEDAVPGATTRPSRIPHALSDSAFFTDRALSYLKGRDGKPFFLHLGYYRPHPPFVASAPYHAMYDAADMARPSAPEASRRRPGSTPCWHGTSTAPGRRASSAAARVPRPRWTRRRCARCARPTSA